MNRNTSSHFSATDNQINIGRSKFARPSSYKATANFGDLIPFYVDEILPGDTFDLNTSVLARLQTLAAPVLDNCYLDTYFFFCPSRILFDKFEAMHGQADPNEWIEREEILIPAFDLSMFASDSDEFKYSAADYFGIPLNNYNQQAVGNYISALPFRGYQLIWNEWFRDQNLQDPVFINKGYIDSIDPYPEFERLVTLRKANKFHDYFTSALPAPQKGPAVIIPGLEDIPIVTGAAAHSSEYPMKIKDTTSPNAVLGFNRDSSNDLTAVTGSGNVYPANLYTGEALGATIDSLRTAFQIQKLLWRDGNGGTRYTEILRSHFGVVSPDGRLQRPEYLGGKRIPLTIQQVIQNGAAGSATGFEATPLATTGAMSKTVDSFHAFTKSFTEHGYLIGVCCARADHTYQNGINKLWSRRSRFDFYYPELANIGEQPIYNREIYAKNNADDAKVFGYQEAWADYRYRPSYLAGDFRGKADEGLSFWTFADYYDSLPTLSAGWIEEPFENVNRALIYDGSETDHNQLLLDFYFDLKCVRPMPVYSVPGLVDHF